MWSEEDKRTIINLVRERPRTVQEVAHGIERSWVTAERYLRSIAETSGEIGIHTFRPGSRGAVKVAYYTVDALPAERIERRLAKQILQGRSKSDFDVLDLAQHSGARIERLARSCEPQVERSRELIASSRSSVLIYSGNLSFLRHDGLSKALEDAIRRGVAITILCRITAGTLANLERVPEGCSIRHCYQPLRGLVVDAHTALLAGFEESSALRDGELLEDVVYIATFTETRWISLLTRTFWTLWRTSHDGLTRISLLADTSEATT